MNRNKAKELLPIIRAYAEGKPVQSRCIKGDTSFWYDDERPNFDDDDLEYRIKPEPTYRPFKDAKECWAEMQKHQPFGWVKDNESLICLTKISLDTDFYFRFQNYTFADGLPFGVKVEE